MKSAWSSEEMYWWGTLFKMVLEYRGGKNSKNGELAPNLSFLILPLLLFCIYSVKEPKDLFAGESDSANVLMKKEKSWYVYLARRKRNMEKSRNMA